LTYNLSAQAAAKGTASVLKTPVKLSDEISIIPTKKAAEKKVTCCELVTFSY
jgi:hypothetical protein